MYLCNYLELSECLCVDKVVELWQVDEYLYHLPIKALPGIGHVLEEKLRKQNIQTCGQLRMISKVIL